MQPSAAPPPQVAGGDDGGQASHAPRLAEASRQAGPPPSAEVPQPVLAQPAPEPDASDVSSGEDVAPNPGLFQRDTPMLPAPARQLREPSEKRRRYMTLRPNHRRKAQMLTQAQRIFSRLSRDTLNLLAPRRATQNAG